MTHKLVVNGRFLTRRITGVERYGLEILRQIGGRLQVQKPKRALSGLSGHIWEQFILPAKLSPDSILWSPANTGPLLIRDQVLTIHDLSPLEHPEWFRSSFAAWYRLFLPILAKRVRRILVPSDYIKQKVTKRFAVDNITVTPEGVDSAIFHPNAKQDGYYLPSKYILSVGTLEPRKNLPLLLQTWSKIKNEFKDMELVIAGETGRVFRNVSMPHDLERVRFLGYVPEAHLAGLYARATLFVLPSKDEGFGLPALEAMACGIPTIASDGGALPETICDAGMIFNLDNPDGLTTAIRTCLNDRSLYNTLKEKGLAHAGSFTWEQTSNIVWKVLNDF